MFLASYFEEWTFFLRKIHGCYSSIILNVLDLFYRITVADTVQLETELLLLSSVCSLCVLGNCNSPLVARRDVGPSNAVILPIYEVTMLIASTNRQTDMVSFLKRTVAEDDNLTSLSITYPFSSEEIYNFPKQLLSLSIILHKYLSSYEKQKQSNF